jgi:hypothetical protein
MEEPARHLLFHGVIILLIALLAGIPYGKSILKKEADNIIFAWRVAHSALTIGAILMLSLVPILSMLNVNLEIMWTIAVLFIVSGYAFSFALYLGPTVGYRGLTHRGPLPAKLVYLGNSIGALTSLLGTFVLLYASWLTL